MVLATVVVIFLFFVYLILLYQLIKGAGIDHNLYSCLSERLLLGPYYHTLSLLLVKKLFINRLAPYAFTHVLYPHFGLLFLFLLLLLSKIAINVRHSVNPGLTQNICIWLHEFVNLHIGLVPLWLLSKVALRLHDGALVAFYINRNWHLHQHLLLDYLSLQLVILRFFLFSQQLYWQLQKLYELALW